MNNCRFCRLREQNQNGLGMLRQMANRSRLEADKDTIVCCVVVVAEIAGLGLGRVTSRLFLACKD